MPAALLWPPASESDRSLQPPSSSALQSTRSVSTHAAHRWERHTPLLVSHIFHTDARHRIGSWTFDTACTCRKWSAVGRRCSPAQNSHALGVRRGTRSGRCESSGVSLLMARLWRGSLRSCDVMEGRRGDGIRRWSASCERKAGFC